MRALEILRLVHEAGLTLRADGQRLIVAPASTLTPEIREMLAEHKEAVLTFLDEAARTTDDLIEVAMRACDRYGDGPAARAQMVSDCRNTPLHLQPDLRDHFHGKRSVEGGTL